jgi:aromatic amino acid aminotransferase I
MVDHEVAELKVSCMKRRAMDFTGFLTEESSSRRPSALKAAFKHLDIPGIVSLGGGLPLPAYFPIHEVTVHVPSIGKWSEEETASHGVPISIVKYASPPTRVADTNGVANGDKVATLTTELTNEMLGPVVGLSSTLQYGLGTGDPHLVSFLKQHTQMVHNPPYEDWSTTLSCGNTYSFYTCLRMLLERGDHLVMEEFAYSSAISACGPMGINIVGVEMDDQGMTATGLDSVLKTWDMSRGRKPRVVYLVPYVSHRQLIQYWSKSNWSINVPSTS